jgi:DNA-binding IclR family transcriptional regulator
MRPAFREMGMPLMSMRTLAIRPKRVMVVGRVRDAHDGDSGRCRRRTAQRRPWWATAMPLLMLQFCKPGRRGDERVRRCGRLDEEDDGWLW